MIRSVAIAMLVIACGANPAPKAPATPSPAVRADVAAAEKAELARQHDVARARYEHAIASAQDPPSQAFARHEYAETLASWGEVAAAIAQLDQVVALAPDDASAWHDLGVLRDHEGDHRNALVALEHAKSLAPRDPRPRIALAALRWCTGDLPGARAEYTDLLSLDVPDRLREKIHWALDALARGDRGRCRSAGS